MPSDCPTGFIFIAITGRPGVGKTTTFMKVLDYLNKKGLKVAGFYCPEVRLLGRRIGFKIVSVDSKVERWLARREGCDGPQVGRYKLCNEAVEVAKYANEQAEKADVVMVDEIGPMELKMREVKDVIIRLLDLRKPGIFVVHERLRDPGIRRRLDNRTCWFQVTLDNRDYIIKPILEAVEDALERASSRYEQSSIT